MNKEEQEKKEAEKSDNSDQLAKRLAAHLGFLITAGIMDLSGTNAWKVKKAKQEYSILPD